MKEKESLFEEHERINEEKGSESAKERHDKSAYSFELKLDSFLSEEICLLSNQINPFLVLIFSYEQNFQDRRKGIGGKLHHNHKETSISFSSNSLPLSIKFSFKELKMNDYCSYVANVDSFVLGFENKEEIMLAVQVAGIETKYELLCYNFELLNDDLVVESMILVSPSLFWNVKTSEESKILGTNKDILKEDDPYNLISKLLKENGFASLEGYLCFIHWRSKRKIYNFVEDTKSRFERFEDQTRKSISYCVYCPRTTALTKTYRLDSRIGEGFLAFVDSSIREILESFFKSYNTKSGHLLRSLLYTFNEPGYDLDSLEVDILLTRSSMCVTL
ncbi:hypothetical protein M9H77_36251 [Catharanthus roseus]|uniref:Uncharacterized protein n=1 Tax=Catharanthus roseus TaxID=4058 RepID=A0ACB9ZTV3_CATRO|nr:hypothetical protein M9H77_36251 [Catharanthus roseus]